VVVLDDVECGIVVVVWFGSVVVLVLAVLGVVGEVEVVVGTAMAGVVVGVVVGATLGTRVVGVGRISPFGPT
jgi:hypothetical protein